MPGIVNPFWYAASLPGHRYWGIKFPADSPTKTAFVMNTLQLMETYYGVDIAPGNSSGDTGHFSTDAAANMFDNVETTFYSSVNASSDMIAWCEFAANKEIVQFFCRPRQNNHPAHHPRNFDFVYSDDGSTWTTYFSITGYTWPAPVVSGTAMSEIQEFHDPAYTPPTSLVIGPQRHWGIQMERNGGTSAFGFVEIELRATAGGADQTAPGLTCSADSTFGSETPDKAIDNNTGTNYSASNRTPSFKWMVDFGAGNEKVINQIAIRARTGGNSTQCPIRMFVISSTNGTTWQKRWLIDDTATGAFTTGEQRVFTSPITYS